MRITWRAERKNIRSRSGACYRGTRPRRTLALRVSPIARNHSITKQNGLRNDLMSRSPKNDRLTAGGLKGPRARCPSSRGSEGATCLPRTERRGRRRRHGRSRSRRAYWTAFQGDSKMPLSHLLYAFHSVLKYAQAELCLGFCDCKGRAEADY